MKTKYLYYIASIAMLTACSNNEEYETVTNDGLQKVTFADPFVGKGLTKASGDITTAELKNFKVKVWGDLIGTFSTGGTAPDVKGSYTQHSTDAPFYNGDEISFSSDAWSSTKEYYYPRDKFYYRFAAFAPANALEGNGAISVSMDPNYQTFSGATASEYGLSNVPLVQEIDNTSATKGGWDLLVSNRVLSSPTNGINDRAEISFTFQHILSRLSFYVYTTEQEGSVKVTSIKAYLPKGATGQYRQNNATEQPTAETQDNNQTSPNEGNNYNSKNSTWKPTENDSWYWTTGFTDITDVVTPTDFDAKVVNNSSNTYQEYEVQTNASGDDVKHADSFSAAIADATIRKIGKEYFLAPTPAYNDGTSDQVANYHFFVKVEYSATIDGVTKNYTGYINLYDADFYRFKQGWHHKLYLNLSSKKIRFISAEVSEWDNTNHNEDMTVSREVEGWTAEQN